MPRNVETTYPRGVETKKVGWHPDPDRPGIERYWEGEGWSTEIAPRLKPEAGWKQARIIALGILIAAACVFAFVRLSQPSDAECANQRADVFFNQRTAVESACVGRG